MRGICLSLTHETNFQTDTVSSSARRNNATASKSSRDVDENSPSMFVLTGQAGRARIGQPEAFSKFKTYAYRL